MHLDRFPGIRQIPRLVSRRKRGTAVFLAWHGKYSDNPRAISEELTRRGSDMRQIWVLSESDPSLPDSVITVEPGSRAYLRALGSCEYLISNNTLPLYFRKSPSTVYLQTWHGTPLKRIAFDIDRPAFRQPERYFTALRREVASWDLLISPNEVSTPILQRAFDYRGRMLETGYPRNDILRSPERQSVRRRVREQLQVASEAHCILYAPTWRDDPEFALELDVREVVERLADEYVLLFRGHHLVSGSVRLPSHPRILDVSSRADVRDLYLAADSLITDYSSVMFDFAVTRKPMLFYTYDLENYRDVLRGFYFDFAREAPGPLLKTTSEVIAALNDLDHVSADYASAYERFWERFCHLDDGGAAGRVVEAVFER